MQDSLVIYFISQASKELNAVKHQCKSLEDEKKEVEEKLKTLSEKHEKLQAEVKEKVNLFCSLSLARDGLFCAMCLFYRHANIRTSP